MSYRELLNCNHCGTCGATLNKSAPNIHRYNEETGDPIYRVSVRCPLWRWWKLSTHFNAEFEGDEMIVYYDY